jgi:hypothetical protein
MGFLCEDCMPRLNYSHMGVQCVACKIIFWNELKSKKGCPVDQYQYEDESAYKVSRFATVDTPDGEVAVCRSCILNAANQEQPNKNPPVPATFWDRYNNDL